MNIDSALEKIYSLKQFHVKLGLDNITNLLNHIGNPQEKLRTIHVAGSNGKGSTCSFLASILQELGYKVGLYTSPHFVKFNERIRVNGKIITDEEIIDFLETNKNYIDEFRPTFFEITTAMAFNYFKKKEVDFGIIETGLGGRLDATNIITPEASVITSISFEHSHILGNTLEKIAYEKGGIIKDNVPVFIGKLPDEATNEIAEIANFKQAKVYKISDMDFKLLENRKELFKNIELKGRHQIANASLAINVISNILSVSDYKVLKRGLDNVVRNTGIQGRYEYFGKNKNVIFDAAHNLEGIQIFIEEFKKDIVKFDNCNLIFGAMRDKQIGEMLSILSPSFSKIFVTSTNYDRAATAEEIFLIAKQKNIDVSQIKDPAAIVEKQIKSDNNTCLVVLGSIYLLGEIKKKLIFKN